MTAGFQVSKNVGAAARALGLMAVFGMLLVQFTMPPASVQARDPEAVDEATPTATPEPDHAELTVNFPGLSSIHVYVHASDGVPGSFGQEVTRSTWKTGSATLDVPFGVFDVRIVQGPAAIVIDDVACIASRCRADAPVALLTVSFLGLTSTHVYVQMPDGLPGTYGVEVTRATWQSDIATLAILSGTYDIRVTLGPSTTVLDGVNCGGAACSADVRLSTLAVDFPGLTNTHVYVQMSDGVPGTYGDEVARATWQSDSAAFTLPQGVFDLRVVRGPSSTVIDDVDCTSGACSAGLPLSALTVDFPGLTSTHAYVHMTDGVAGSYGDEVARATWQSDSAAFTLPRGVFDIRVVRGPVTTVIDDVACTSGTCSAALPLSALTVLFPDLASTHVYVHITDGAGGTYGQEVTRATWQSESAAFALPRGVFDIRVVRGPATTVIDNVDCTSGVCSAAVPLARLTVNFPGLSSAHVYVHMRDGADGSFGEEVMRATWQTDTSGFTLPRGVFDLRIVRGPSVFVLDDIDCTGIECTANVALTTLTVDFPNLTSAHVYVQMADGSDGTYGQELTRATWQADRSAFTVLPGDYDIRVVRGPSTMVIDGVECGLDPCSVDVPLANLTVTFPGSTSVHAYVHATDGIDDSFGPEVIRANWQSESSAFTLLQGVYDVRLLQDNATLLVDDVDCNPTASRDLSIECRVDFSDVEASTPIARATETSTPSAQPSETPTPSDSGPPAGISMEFHSVDDEFVTWKVFPRDGHAYRIWDDYEIQCSSHGGADCGAIEEDFFATFSTGSPGQYLLLSQRIVQDDDDACRLQNEALFTEGDGKEPTGSVRADYVCSGASALGPWLLGLGFVGAVAVAWVVRRKADA